MAACVRTDWLGLCGGCCCSRLCFELEPSAPVSVVGRACAPTHTDHARARTVPLLAHVSEHACDNNINQKKTCLPYAILKSIRDQLSTRADAVFSISEPNAQRRAAPLVSLGRPPAFVARGSAGLRAPHPARRRPPPLHNGTLPVRKISLSHSLFRSSSESPSAAALMRRQSLGRSRICGRPFCG